MVSLPSARELRSHPLFTHQPGKDVQDHIVSSRVATSIRGVGSTCKNMGSG